MEVLRFGHCGWWWKLRWAVWREFRDLDIAAIVGGESADLSYGETPTVTLARILEVAELTPGARFVDLGAGRGVTVLAAALMGYSASGLEIVGEYVLRARRAAQRLAVEVEFRQQDFLQGEWPEGDLYLMNSTAFGEDMRDKLTERLRELGSQSMIVTYDWSLDPTHFEEQNALRLPVTRGTVMCRFFRPR
jgi:protein-L-isoaspartate O-methyltransferase